jgi:hypothetical protein
MSRVQSFPAVSRQEFAEACQALERRSADTISGTDWLSVRWTGEELLIRKKHKIEGFAGNDGHAEGIETEEVDGEEVEDAADDAMVVSNVSNCAASRTMSLYVTSASLSAGDSK